MKLKNLKNCLFIKDDCSKMRMIKNKNDLNKFTMSSLNKNEFLFYFQVLGTISIKKSNISYLLIAIAISFLCKVLRLFSSV